MEKLTKLEKILANSSQKILETKAILEAVRRIEQDDIETCTLISLILNFQEKMFKKYEKCRKIVKTL